MRLISSSGRAALGFAQLALFLGCGFGPALADDFQSACARPPGPAARTLPANPATFDKVLSQARSGDLVALEDGSYGPIKLAGVNSDFITLAAAPGKKPVMSSLKINGSRWMVRGMIIDGRSSPGSRLAPTSPGMWAPHDYLVYVNAGSDIILDDNTITSFQGAYPWRKEVKGADDFAPLWSGVMTHNTACATISNNKIINIFHGITIEGDQIGNDGKYFRVLNNTIDHFAGDGIEHVASSVLISGNTIVNHHNLCDYQCIHSDGIQGWNYHDKLGIVNYDIRIEGNKIIQQNVPNLELPGDDLHGITIFDGAWRNVDVVNNVVVSGSWHGITVAGVDGLRIINNTVLASMSRRTWLQAGGATHQGAVSKNVIVRNNITSGLNPARNATASMKMDHNLVVDNPRGLFVEVDTAHDRYDLHPRPKSGAVGHGSRDLAPPFDIDGKPRGTHIDIGAYQQSGS